VAGQAEYQRTGTLWVAEDDEQLKLVHTKLAYYTERGVRAELLDAKALAEAEPYLRPLAGALLVPDDGVLYPPALARLLLERALQQGGRLRVGVRVERLENNTVLADGERLTADIIVNAAGVAAPLLTEGLPIVPRKGHLVITDRYPGFCRHQLVELGYLKSAHTMNAASVAFNLQPRHTGQVLIGSSRELVGWDASINRTIVRQMVQRALQFVPALASLSALRTWIGFRPATPDKLPLIGPWEPQKGVWIAAGHEGLGITTALGTARLLADLITGRVPALAADLFSPMRTLNAEAA
jgi:glycine/D-amino acid oxidase-like deaminating enzyme